MVFASTITVLSAIAGGLWVVCASVFATAGWTAPACLAAGIASGVDLVLAVVDDAVNYIEDASNDPDTRSVAIRTNHFLIHDGGEMEDYTGRLHELYGRNETMTILDATRGYTHTLTHGKYGAHVETDLAQFSTSTSTRRSVFQRHTASEPSNSLTKIAYDAEKLGSDHPGYSSSDADSIGQYIANNAWQLGTYCLGLSAYVKEVKRGIAPQERSVGEIGLTLMSPNYEPSPQGPCY